MGTVRSRPGRQWLPGLVTARSYERAWLRHDLVAGAVLAALLVPAGIGYAQVAGLPPETGLYATVVPLLAYALVGPSRILVLGPDSTLAPIIGASVLPLAGGDADRAVALAGLLAVLVGVVLVVGGLACLGVLADLLSKPIRIGYLNGIALIVVVGQLPGLLGFSNDARSFPGEVEAIVTEVADGAVDPRVLAIGVTSLLVIAASRRWARTRALGVFAVVLGGSALVAALGWTDEVPVVGAMPTGFPAPTLGGLRLDDVTSLLVPALGIALIAYADSGVLSRTLAVRRGDHVDGSQEMGAIGVANVAAGLSGGFPISASSSRTPVAAHAGARTQLTGVVGAALVLAFVVLAPEATAHLPSAALAAVVIVAASSLVDLAGLRWLARVAPVEAALSLAAFLGVVLVGVLEGIAIALGLSVVAFLHQAWRPYRAVLGRRPGVRGYHDLARHPHGERIPGVVIVRFDAPLFFANGGIFDDFVRSAIDAADDDVHTVILAAEPITDIDSTALDELVELDDHLARRGITLWLAEMKGPVKDRLARYGLAERFGPERFKPTVGAAVDEITGRLRSDIDLEP